jgi:YebC/PmpR family DNA-binding regulatory protein
MAGHSHWAGIKHQKEIADKKRGVVFSKLLAAISVAARTEADPNFNPRLRTAVEKARAANVPQENIERAIKRASEAGQALEEFVFEAYGPGGTALLISAASDNGNRTVQEVKKILGDFGGKWAEPGSVTWGFSKTQDGWAAKFPVEIGPEDSEKLSKLVSALLQNDGVQEVYANAKN